MLGELSTQAISDLDELMTELDEIEKDADSLERLGFDMSRLRDRIKWGREVQAVIKDRFGPVKE